MLRAFVRFFSSRPPVTIGLWAIAVAFGVLAYTTLQPREGFPSVDVPIAVASGSYLVDDADRVDREVTGPIADALAEVDGVESVQTFALASSFSVIATLDSNLASAEGAALIEDTVSGLGLPPEATLMVQSINASRFLNEFDLLVGVYAGTDTDAADLEAGAAVVLPSLTARPEVARAEVVELIARAVDPATGQAATVESDFNLLTAAPNGELEFRPSIAIGVVAASGVDSLATRDAVDEALVDAAGDLPAGYDAVVALDFATQIRQQVGSLQSNVLTGVIAVALVALLLISWRASAVTALFIVTVLAVTVGVLYLIGVSLNTISLFGVILSLGLFVDDAIVITESIAANKRDGVDDLVIIDTAIDRVGTASIAGTLTTVLVFAPMLAISGILGDFIRILPLSVITALLVSVVLSFVFIPVATRYLVLPARKQGGILTSLESRAADLVASLASGTGRRGWVRGGLAVGLSVAMTLVGLMVFAPRAGFNIFPPSKDSAFVAVDIAYQPGTSITEARDIAIEINEQAAAALGDDLVSGYVYQGNARGALGQLELTPIGGRPTAPALLEDVLNPLAAAYDRARVRFSQISAGPPEALFPFQVQIYDEDIEVLIPAAEAIAATLDGATIQRPNGTTFQVIETTLALTDSVARTDGRRLVEVRARFDADDVTTTVAQTQSFVEDRYGPQELASLGLAEGALDFDFGLESDNQESFASLPAAFVIALVSMLVLLVVQFRSSVQWLLVFVAIPFSLFGVFGGLLLTNNVISFFVMLGLIGLVGIAVNNTILLTDFANQERRAGHDRRTAIGNAVRQRFRPLVATSLTTVAGLTPLALSDPFWEALGMTIIFGLLSSTFLVLIAFPFYYLAIEALRDRFVTPWRRFSQTPPATDLSPPESSREPAPVG